MEILQIKYILLLVCLSYFQLFGQSDNSKVESIYKPFSILIIGPDSANIDKSLMIYADSIEQEFHDTYYRAIKDLESKKEKENNEKRKETELTIERAKWMEMDVHDFKYYQMISRGTFVALLEKFNNSWAKKSLMCEIEERRWLYTYNLAKLTQYYDVDYIIYFQNIHTEKDEEDFILKMNTLVYSRIDSKVILEKEATGTTYNVYSILRGENPLMCMLSTIVESSTDEIISVLERRQEK